MPRKPKTPEPANTPTTPATEAPITNEAAAPPVAPKVTPTIPPRKIVMPNGTIREDF